ncbi:MAG: hypothetical protein AAFV25_17895 [Bacteroidota bacterium]
MEVRTIHIHQWTLLVLLTLFYSEVSLGQLCGRGTFSCTFLDADFAVLKEVDYQFWDVREEMLSSEEWRDRYNDFYRGVLLSEAEMIALLASPFDPQERPWVTTALKEEGIDLKGKHSSQFEFPTYETFWQPLILQIQSEGESHYFLANFFGGCNRHKTFLLDNKKLAIKCDMNADGRPDFIDLKGLAREKEPGFDVYLFDPSNNTYKYSEEHSKAPPESFDDNWEGRNMSHIENRVYSYYGSIHVLVQKYVSGRGNHYYDNIVLSHISFANRSVEYFPLELTSDELAFLKGEGEACNSLNTKDMSTRMRCI